MFIYSEKPTIGLLHIFRVTEAIQFNLEFPKGMVCMTLPEGEGHVDNDAILSCMLVLQDPSITMSHES